jgi:hypothetical protein
MRKIGDAPKLRITPCSRSAPPLRSGAQPLVSLGKHSGFALIFSLVRKRAGKENKKARSAPELGQIARFARNFGYTGTLCEISAPREGYLGNMGHLGTSISSNDTFKDVYADFMQAHNAKVPLPEVAEQVRNSYSSSLDDPDEAHDVLFAIAKAEWDCGSLSASFLKEISNIIASGADIDRWKRLGASDRDLAKRRQVLDDFLEKLKSKNPRPKIPKPIKLRDSIFKTGDCLAIDLKGKFGGAIVLTHQTQSEWGLNLLLVVDFIKPQPPTVHDLETGFCLLERNLRQQYEPYVQYCYAKFFKKADFEFRPIGTVSVTKPYAAERGMHSYGHWNHITEHILLYNDKRPVGVKPVRVAKMIAKGLFG